MMHTYIRGSDSDEKLFVGRNTFITVGIISCIRVYLYTEWSSGRHALLDDRDFSTPIKDTVLLLDDRDGTVEGPLYDIAETCKHKVAVLKHRTYT